MGGGDAGKAQRDAERRAKQDTKRQESLLRKQEKQAMLAQTQARKISEAQRKAAPKMSEAFTEKGISKKKKRTPTGIASLRINPMQGSSTNIG